MTEPMSAEGRVTRDRNTPEWEGGMICGHFEAVADPAAPDSVHILPRGDAIAHELSDNCLCSPDISVTEDEGALRGWMIAHMAWDDRRR